VTGQSDWAKLSVQWVDSSQTRNAHHETNDADHPLGFGTHGDSKKRKKSDSEKHKKRKHKKRKQDVLQGAGG
jgi:hypothetical protein